MNRRLRAVAAALPAQSQRAPVLQRRCLATGAPLQDPAAQTTPPEPSSAGLAAFFENSNGWNWNAKALPTGRAWSPQAISRKSFDELQKLWLACLLEKNKLASQAEEARRFKVEFPHAARQRQVNTTMMTIYRQLMHRLREYEKARIVAQRVEAQEQLAVTLMTRQLALEQGNDASDASDPLRFLDAKARAALEADARAIVDSSAEWPPAAIKDEYLAQVKRLA